MVRPLVRSDHLRRRGHRPGHAHPAGPPRPRRHRPGPRRRARLARPQPAVDRGARQRTAAARRSRAVVAGLQRGDLQRRRTARKPARPPLHHRLGQRVGARVADRRRAARARPAGGDVGALRGDPGRTVRRGPRPPRHQAPVLGADRRPVLLRVRDARLPGHRPARGGDVPARLLVDAGRRPGPVRHGRHLRPRPGRPHGGGAGEPDARRARRLGPCGT